MTPAVKNVPLALSIKRLKRIFYFFYFFFVNARACTCDVSVSGGSSVGVKPTN